MIRHFSAWLLVLGVFGCNGPTGTSPENPGPESGPISPATGGQSNGLGRTVSGNSADAAAEMADIPEQVTGTYLACSPLAKTDGHAEIGCNARRKDNGRIIDLSKARSSKWSVSFPPDSAGVAATSAGSGPWQVVITCTADEAALATLVGSLAVALDLILAKTGAAQQISGFMPEMLQAAAKRDNLDQALVAWISKVVDGSHSKPTPALTRTVVEEDGVLIPNPPAPPPPPPVNPAASSTSSPAASFPNLTGRHFPTGCRSDASGRYVVKDTFFGFSAGVKMMGRTVSYYAQAGCNGTPDRVVQSDPVQSPYIFAGEPRLPGAIEVFYDAQTTRVTFEILMNGDAQPSRVRFAVGG